MKNILKTEEIIQFALSLILVQHFGFSWMWFFILLLAPDLSMVGYLVSTKIGAFAYNLAHHKGMAIIIFLMGMYLKIQTMQFAGIILFSHSSMDRIFGYGLKHTDSFQNTHLGIIGKSK